MLLRIQVNIQGYGFHYGIFKYIYMYIIFATFFYSLK